jgi:hypothetical protein
MHSYSGAGNMSVRIKQTGVAQEYITNKNEGVHSYRWRTFSQCSYYSLDTGIMTEAFRALVVEAYPKCSTNFETTKHTLQISYIQRKAGNVDYKLIMRKPFCRPTLQMRPVALASHNKNDRRRCTAFHGSEDFISTQEIIVVL